MSQETDPAMQSHTASHMRLLEFPHSHYCEKARWALDYKGVSFQAVALLPGLHLRTVRKYAPDTSVPVLLNNRDAIQGSGDIIDYLDAHYPQRRLTPLDADELRACMDIENAMDKKLGVTIRQILYATLLDYPDFIRHCFTHPMPAYKQWLFRWLYPVLRKKIHQTYVISAARVRRARREFDLAMNELEQLLQGKTYLVGNRFSRADLSVASMLSLLAMPVEHPFPWQAIPDARTETFYAAYADHPALAWVEKMYREHRLPQTQVVPA